MESLKNLKKVLEKEIDEISKKNDISPTELERLDKAVDIIKDIETICAMKEYGYQEKEEPMQGYSERYSYPHYMSYDMMPPREQDMWSRESSYRDGRGSMGSRYVSREMPPYSYDNRSYGYGYSGHSNKEDLKMDLREMMNSAKTEKERMAIQQLLEQWKE